MKALANQPRPKLTKTSLRAFFQAHLQYRASHWLGICDRCNEIRLGTFVAILILGLSGCVSVPKQEATVRGEIGSAEGQWHGKAMVRNIKNGKNGTLELDIIAREPAQLRMEATGSFGVHLASIALNGGEVRYLLPQDKRFVIAPAGADSFSQLVPVHIPPAALLAILFERQLPKEDWLCDFDAAGLAKFCSLRKEDVGVRWLERNGRNRRLKIISRDAEIEMVLDEAKSKVGSSQSIFVLTSPEGYKQERLTSQ